jgi:hypothetical protein
MPSHLAPPPILSLAAISRARRSVRPVAPIIPQRFGASPTEAARCLACVTLGRTRARAASCAHIPAGPTSRLTRPPGGARARRGSFLPVDNQPAGTDVLPVLLGACIETRHRAPGQSALFRGSLGRRNRRAGGHHQTIVLSSRRRPGSMTPIGTGPRLCNCANTRHDRHPGTGRDPLHPQHAASRRARSVRAWPKMKSAFTKGYRHPRESGGPGASGPGPAAPGFPLSRE